MGIGKASLYRNERDISREESAVGILPTHLEKTECMTNCQAFEIYPVHAMRLNLSLEPRQELDHNKNSLFRLLFVDYS